MPQNLLLRSISATCVLALSGLQAGQAPPSVKQDAKNSSCTNIVALAGDVNVNCSSLTPEQKKIIDSIPGLLREIIANQPAVMAKLDKCLEGLPQHRHLTDQQRATLKSATASWPDGWIIVSDVGDMEAKEYSDQFKEVLGAKASTSIAEMGRADTFSGIRIGAPYNNAELRLYNYAKNLASAMKQDGFPDVEFIPRPVAEHMTITPGGFFGGYVGIAIGFPPSTH